VGWILLEQLGQDVRYAFRTMLHNKAFTVLAALSLALGIGANTAIYSFMEALLLRSLPVEDPGSLVVVNWHIRGVPFGKGSKGPATVVYAMSGAIYDDAKAGSTAGILPFPAFEVIEKNDSVFSSVFAFRKAGRLNLSIKGQADVVSGEYVSGDYFPGLGIPPARGRLLIPDDDRAGAPPVAIVSMALSQQRFGSPNNAVGASILIDNVPFTVVGVAPPEFFGVDPGEAPDVYVPLHANLLLEDSSRGGLAAMYLDQHYYWLEAMARLRPGVSLAQAQAALAGPFHQWAYSTAANDHERADLPALKLREGGGGLDGLRRGYSKPLYILMTLVGIILAIACANIANLLLARATARRREMAVRLSTGAARSRIIRQLLTESILLASLGGLLGLFVANWSIRFLTILLVDGILHPALNWHVMIVAAVLALLTGALFGLAPAIQSTRVDIMPALKEVRANQTRSRFRVSLSHVLVVSQIALSLLMLVAAGLFVKTLSNLQSVELGFNRENLLLFQLNARQAGHGDAEIASFYTELQKRLSEIPGVRNVSLSHEALFTAGTGTPIRVPGADSDPATRLLYIGPSFFSTMQIPILLGREIDYRDQASSPQVAVISEQFAKSNFGNENPVGRHLTMEGRDPRDLEIVGVVREARYGGLKGAVPPVVYIPYSQGSQKVVSRMTYALRTSGDPLTYVNTVREIVHQADTRVPVTTVKTQTAQIDETISREIAFAKLCTALAILGLLIACVGLYGTLSYNVARRTGEIGIRVALGAQRGGVIWMVLREVFVLVALGLMIGVPAAFAASRLIESFLFGMKPNDPFALTLAVAILLCAALVAGWVPARRASRIDPMIALRQE
jgi:macrolide transport system ATP-binding/permease protein